MLAMKNNNEITRIDFGINGMSDVAVEYNGYVFTFLVASPDGNGMMAVTYTEFMDAFKSLAYTCITSWNYNLTKEFKDFDKAVKILIDNKKLVDYEEAEC